MVGVASVAVTVWSIGPAAAAPGTCSVYWTGTTDSNWIDASNWSLNSAGTGAGRVPLATDFACMSTAPVRTAVEYSSLSRTVAGINFGVAGSTSPTLTIDGGRLTIGSASGSFDSVINDLALVSGGMLRGTADHLLTGTPSISDNAIIDGVGTTTLATGTVVRTNGLVLDNGRRLVVNGSLTHADCYDYLYLYNGAVLQNSGRFTADSACGNRVYSDGSDGSKIINDAGATFAIRQSATQTYSLEGNLDNRGTVSVSAGSLVVRPLAAGVGRYDLAPGSQLLVASGGTLRIEAGSMVRDQTIVVTGGVLDVAAGVSVASVDVRTGSLTGGPTVTTFSASPGTVFTGGGTLTIAAGGTATVDGLRVDGQSTLLNRGTLNHTGCLGPLALRNGSVLENAGTIAIACGSAVTTDGTPGTAVRNNAGARLTVTMPSTTPVYGVDAVLTNDGTLEVTRGRLKIATLTNLVNGRLSGGNYVVTGGFLEIPADVMTNAATITVITPGDLVTPANTRALIRLRTNHGALTITQSLTTETALTNTGAVTVTGQTLKPLTYTQTAGTTTIASGASLVGASGANSVFINGGTITGAGRVGQLAGSGTTYPDRILTVNGVYGPASTARLEISVNGPADNGKLAVQYGATLTGTLSIVTAPGFTPAPGTVYTILTTSKRTAEFTTIEGQNLPGGTYYDVGYTATSVTLTVRQLPQLRVADAAATVGTAGDTPMTFTVSLTAPSSQLVTVDYETVDGSARAGSDYVAKSGTLQFPAGVQALNVVVTIKKDVGPEPVETFSLVLSRPGGAGIGDGTGTGQITHNADAATAPVVTGVAPQTLGLGAWETKLDILGGNFVPTSTVSIVGSKLTLVATTYINAQTLRITVNATGATTLGPNDVTVTNAGIGSDTCEACLTVTPRPQPTSASPNLATGAAARTVTVTGTAFKAGSTVVMAGNPGVKVNSTTFVSSTKLQVSVTLYPAAVVGGYDVRVTNPDKGVGVCTDCFYVLAGPTVTGMTPSTILRGTTRDVTITGTRFVTGAVVRMPPDVGISNVVVVNSTTITARISVPSDRSTGTDLVITVVNPASAGYGEATCKCLTITR